MTKIEERLAKQEERMQEMQEEKQEKEKEKREKEKELQNFSERFNAYYRPGGKLKIPDYVSEITKSTTAQLNSPLLSEDTDWKKISNELYSNLGIFNYSKMDNCLFYNLYYLPTHFLKLPVFLSEFFKASFLDKGWFEDKEKIRVLDLGSGPGTMILAFLDFCYFLKEKLDYKIPEIEFYILERNKDFIRILKNNLKMFDKQNLGIKYSKNIISKWEYVPSKKMDIIIASNVLKEIKKQQDKDYENKITSWLSSKFSKYLAIDGIFCCIETQDSHSGAIFQLLRKGYSDKNRKIERCVFSNFMLPQCSNCPDHKSLHNNQSESADFGQFVKTFVEKHRGPTHLNYRIFGFQNTNHG